ncbi:MAG: hypothetical protein AAGI90_05490 [Chlamydiota bacterium]
MISASSPSVCSSPRESQAGSLSCVRPAQLQRTENRIFKLEGVSRIIRSYLPPIDFILWHLDYALRTKRSQVTDYGSSVAVAPKVPECVHVFLRSEETITSAQFVDLTCTDKDQTYTPLEILKEMQQSYEYTRTFEHDFTFDMTVYPTVSIIQRMAPKLLNILYYYCAQYLNAPFFSLEATFSALAARKVEKPNKTFTNIPYCIFKYLRTFSISPSGGIVKKKIQENLALGFMTTLTSGNHPQGPREIIEDVMDNAPGQLSRDQLNTIGGALLALKIQTTDKAKKDWQWFFNLPNSHKPNIVSLQQDFKTDAGIAKISSLADIKHVLENTKY